MFPHKRKDMNTESPAPKYNSHLVSDIDNCHIIELPRHFDPNGKLTEVENTSAFPFNVKRVFYLYDVPADSQRGGHSHHLAQEIIVAVSGCFDVEIDDGYKKKRYRLDRPYMGLYIQQGVWRNLDCFSAGSVCLVLTDQKYDEADYVRDYNYFLTITHPKTREDKDRVYKFVDLGVNNRKYIDQLKEAAIRVIESGRYIGGAEVEALERDLATMTGAPYSIGVSNGLDALRLILRAYIELGRLNRGDEVIVAANTYIASVLAITDNGLKPLFVEPDEQTFNLDSSKVEDAITPRTKAIMPVHLYGRVCWDKALREIASKHNLLVIEDNAQAIGAESLEPGMLGHHTTGALGHAAAFSFYPTKNVGALGDAGAVVTHDAQLAKAVDALRNYGSDRRYHNVYAGLNCRLDPLQAAFVRVKLDDIDNETEHRRKIAGIYCTEIKNPKVTLPVNTGDNSCVWHQFVVKVTDREGFRSFLSNHGVMTDVLYPTPPHLQPCYREYATLDLPVTCRLANEVVSLPVSPTTSVEDAHEISRIVNMF